MTEHERPKRSGELTVALIAAAFGLVGVMAGGLITYFTSREVQDREIARQEEREFQAARTAAAMESFRFESASAQLDALVVTKRDTAYTREYVASRLPTVDTATMLAHLDSTRSRTYAQAQFCLGSVAKIMRSHTRGRALNSHEVLALRVQKDCVDEGRRALDGLAAR